ncbi:hypothetical protein [Verrucomicrobium sp. BvORR034]|uniref:hypothetical protein n=1 Tax=Verrucomicrobium sp. BvORR034 TaxID=1396418 RepID=UPI002240F3D4|nr:hypothetical protein [Verrucomicrobium sp. BvORR034]
MAALSTQAADPPALGKAAPAASQVKASAQQGALTLVSPKHAYETVLLDSSGKEVHVWTSTAQGAGGVRMQKDGSLLRLGRMPLPPPFDKYGLMGGRLQILGWDDKVEWDFLDAVSDHMAYGDALVLPNGNVLTAVLEHKTREECEALGRRSEDTSDTGLFVPGLMEFQRNGKKTGIPVWKWSVTQHVYQARHPNLPDYSYPQPKAGRVDVGMRPSPKSPVWLMPTEIDHHTEHDLVLMVVGGLGELWVLDHSTTAAESGTSQGARRDKGGDILLRWNGMGGVNTGQAKGAVLSAEWVQKSPAGKGPLITVLRFDGVKQEFLAEEVELDESNFEVKAVTPLWNEKRATQVADAKATPVAKGPSALSRDPVSGSLLLTDIFFGSLRRTEQGKATWDHQNTRGKITMSLTVGSKGGEGCCGGQQGKADDTASTPSPATTPPPIKLEVASTVKAHLYPKNSLQRQP